jgi:hypothetical protein
LSNGCIVTAATAKYLMIALLLGAPAVCPAQLVNGDFATGDFTGWTIFTDPGGDTGATAVVPFDITGTGLAANSAQFQVGATNLAGTGVGLGGGISQDVTLLAGYYQIQADIAAYNPDTGLNYDAGNFELTVDGNLVATNFLGFINAKQTLRSNLDATVMLSAGTHEIAIAMRRPWLSGDPPGTPDQYLDYITLSGLLVSEPLNCQRCGAVMVLTWTNQAFSLQVAPAVTGVFTNLPGASSPYTNALCGAGQYFRLMAN